ncbi:MAG: hypothetical protein JNK72_16490 [Myxococcales bacterium]|nr:hypothetical protein [Myxococcales bacterium]
MAGSDDDLSDLPDVPDGVVDDDRGVAPASSDDEAARQINRRVSPFGWLVIASVLAVGGGTGYFLINSAKQEAAEADEATRGRQSLTEILNRNLPNDETARLVREVYAGNRSMALRQAARRILAGLRDPQSVPLLIEGLDTPGAPRAQAALGLAEIGLPAAEPARAALLRALPTTDPNTDRIEVAWALVVLNEPQAWPTVRDLLETNKLQQVNGLDSRRAFDPALVARMAGVSRLHELVTSRNVASRQLAAISLAEIASAETLDDLGVLARDSQESIAREAAIGLGRSGDPRATDNIMAFLGAHPTARDGVITALATSAGAPALAVIIHGARDLETRAFATRLLREQRDPGAGDALAEALQLATASTEPAARDMKKNAIFGLAEIGDIRAVEGLLGYAQYGLEHPADINGTQEAKLALDQIRRVPGAAARAKTQLAAMLRDPRADFVRSQLIMALAVSGDASMASVFQSMLAQPDTQGGAAMAVCALRAPSCFSTIVSNIRQPQGMRMVEATVQDQEVAARREAAIRGAAWASYTPPASAGVTVPAMTPQQRASLIGALRRVVEDPTDRRELREEAGYALAALADEAALNEMATRAGDTNVPAESRIFYIYALRGRCTPAIAGRLIETYLRRGVDPEIMKGAAIAAGFGADDSTSEALIRLLGSTDPQDGNVRFAAAVAIVLGGNQRAANELVNALQSNDELNGLLRNTFQPRATGNAGNNSVVQENAEIVPLTRAMFEDGRVFRRFETAALLERGRASRQYNWAMQALTLRLKTGWDNPIGAGAFEVRELLRAAALGSDAARQETAFKALRATVDRGSLHALRRQTANARAAELARRELLNLSAAGSTISQQ